MAAILLAIGASFYFLYDTNLSMQKRRYLREKSNENMFDHTKEYMLDPYQNNQFQTISDIIYSPYLEANDVLNINKVPSDGLYGISQYGLKFSSNEPTTLMYRYENLIK